MISPMFDDSTILITGGTGSFGHAAVKHFLDNANCREIRVFSRDELKQDVMRRQIGSPKVKFYLGDVRDLPSLDNAVVGVDFIFHAAAVKQVPSCEFFPLEAVKTNILGSSNVIESAVRHGVRKIVCLSTDKAVLPINAMGMTKALLEKVVVATARRLEGEDTVVGCVRYGNVLCSRGSVVPLFIEKIKAGKPIPVTEPEMTRFLLPMPDAIQLIDYCMRNMSQGDKFVKKSPACTIMDLATALKEIFESEVPIEIIGIRHGEKIFETLVSAEELRLADDLGSYYRIKIDDRSLNYDLYFSQGDRNKQNYEDYTSHNTERLNVGEIKELLLSLPEVRSEL